MPVGLDGGTAFLVGSRRDENGKINFVSQRNCFLTIDNSDDITEMLKKSGAKVIINGDKVNVLGEDAIMFSNMMSNFVEQKDKVILKRPMKNGVLNSSEEPESLSILQSLIEGVIGKPQVENETCVFSCPSNPINSEENNVFHTAMFKQILSKLGYNPIALNEALAVIYSENPEMGEKDNEMPMSGIAISLGAGQVNVCMAMRSYPMIEFSLTGSGDYIDNQVSILSGKSRSVVTKIKETNLDFTKIDYSDMVMAGLDIHYGDLLKNILNNFSKKFSEASESYEYPIEIVVTGGTAKPKGFINKFKEVVKEVDLPFELKGIRLSSDMLNTVSKGCLLRAIQEKEKG